MGHSTTTRGSYAGQDHHDILLGMPLATHLQPPVHIIEVCAKEFTEILDLSTPPLAIESSTVGRVEELMLGLVVESPRRMVATYDFHALIAVARARMRRGQERDDPGNNVQQSLPTQAT